MGQKDYQQCMVVKKMISDQHLKTAFYTCPTLREADGLAMSSRNMRLNETERKNAGAIFKALVFINDHITTGNLTDTTGAAAQLLLEYGFKTDYVAIAGADDLQIVDEWDGRKKLVALIAAFQHEVRLIDNMILKDEHK
jgi:pantoate--beta-alanine ligase